MPANNWYQGRKIIDVARLAADRIRDIDALVNVNPSITSDYINQHYKHLKNAWWWMKEYNQGNSELDIRELVRYFADANEPESQHYCDKDSWRHQRVARIAGYWVPGRKPGALNKPKTSGTVTGSNWVPSAQALNPTPAPVATPAPNQVMQMTTGAVGVTQSGPSFQPEELANLLDTSSMSTQDIWKAVVCILTSAKSDQRDEEDLVTIREVIDVLTPLMD